MNSKIVIGKDVDLPLTGALPFGIIDRGTDLFQVRPVSGCNLRCPFCSVDEGPCGKKKTRYEVDLDYMVEYAQALISRKNCSEIEMHIDGCGEPTLYDDLNYLVDILSEMDKVKTVSMQSNGTLLKEEDIETLERAGLDRLNLTMNALESDLAEELAGTQNYDLEHVKDIAKRVGESKIELLVAPVWIPGVNDQEMEKIIDFVKEVQAENRFPRLGIQKYREHKRGRKIEGVSPMDWNPFFEELKEMEERKKVKLLLRPEDFDIKSCDFALPKVMKKGEKVNVKLEGEGWMNDQKLGVARKRTVTVVNSDGMSIGNDVKVEILRNKHNLYVGRPI